MRAWLNGRLLEDAGEAALSVLDHGLTVGDGVFETVKAVDGQPFALTRHLSRLARSAQGLGLPAPDEVRVREAVTTVLDGISSATGRVRITVTGGPGPLGSDRGDDVLEHLAVLTALDRGYVGADQLDPVAFQHAPLV